MGKLVLRDKLLGVILYYNVLMEKKGSNTRLCVVFVERSGCALYVSTEEKIKNNDTGRLVAKGYANYVFDIVKALIAVEEVK